MPIKKFIIKTTTKILLFVFLLLVITAVGQALNPVINNELALTQMEPSNGLYVLTNTYRSIQPIFNLLTVCIGVWCFISVVRDTHKFIKSLEHE